MIVTWQPKAAKQLLKIGDRKIRQRITQAVGGLEQLARVEDCAAAKALTHHRYPYRLRVGNWRVFFSLILGEPVIVHIEEVKKRDERTY